jgi:hypothetical protein
LAIARHLSGKPPHRPIPVAAPKAGLGIARDEDVALEQARVVEMPCEHGLIDRM